ncbi:unnamed protein product, partial [Didymodactylos carnosus]
VKLEIIQKQFGNDSICPIPIFIKISLEDIFKHNNIDWNISLGNLTRKTTEYGHTMEIIRQFDFNNVYSITKTPRDYVSCQQEFLIKSELSLDIIENIEIICQDIATVECLKSMLDNDNQFKTKIKYSEQLSKSLYLNKNPKFVLRPSNENQYLLKLRMPEQKKFDKLILQYSNKINYNYTTNSDDLNDFSQTENIVTIYGDEQLMVLTDIKNINYAIYYVHQGQLWLIQANYKNPKFTLPIVRQTLKSILENTELIPNPNQIIDTLMMFPFLEFLYNQMMNNSESLKQYTLKIIEIFQKYFLKQNRLVSRSFYMLLAIHALGLPQAKYENKIHEHQRFTIKLIDEISDIIPIAVSILEQMKTMIKSDNIEKLVNAGLSVNMPEPNVKKLLETLYSNFANHDCNQ